MTRLVRYDRVITDGRAHAVVTLDSDHNRNALSAQLLDELRLALQAAANDDALAVVVRAEGRAFCAGADLTEAYLEGMEASAHRLADLIQMILAHPLPIVARVHGPVRAGGLGILAACDLAVAADHVTYAFTEARLGLTPAVISLSVLPRMNPRHAGTTFLTADTFGAKTALESGLITHAAPSDRLDATVDELVAHLKVGERQGLEATKRLLNADALRYLDDRMEGMVALSAELFASDVARRHLAAFVR